MVTNKLLTRNIYPGECSNCSATLREKGLMFHQDYVPHGTPAYELPIWCNLKCYNQWVHRRNSSVDTLPCNDLFF